MKEFLWLDNQLETEVFQDFERSLYNKINNQWKGLKKLRIREEMHADIVNAAIFWVVLTCTAITVNVMNRINDNSIYYDREKISMHHDECIDKIQLNITNVQYREAVKKCTDEAMNLEY